MWREICKEFKNKGYSVSETILDRKFRNMKHHYKTIVDNNKKTKTGRGRICWEYFNAFEEIFVEDKTIHSGPILSSFTFKSSYNSVPSSTPKPSCSHTSEPILQTTADLSTPIASSICDPNNLLTSAVLSNISPLHVDTSTDEVMPHLQESIEQRSTNKRKACEMKALYSVRKEFLEIEKKRVAAIEKLSRELAEHNIIQKERNELIKRIHKLD